MCQKEGGKEICNTGRGPHSRGREGWGYIDREGVDDICAEYTEEWEKNLWK